MPWPGAGITQAQRPAGDWTGPPGARLLSWVPTTLDAMIATPRPHNGGRGTLYHLKATGRQVCGVQLQGKPGQRCACSPTKLGNGRCRFHGGVRGVGRPITHGRYSRRYGRFQEALEAAAASPHSVDLARPIAVLNEAMDRAAERASAQDVPAYRRRALELWRAAQGAEDGPQAAASQEELGKLLEDGVAEDRAFESMVSAAERLATRLEKFHTIRNQAAQAINVHDLMVIFAQVVEVIRQEAPSGLATRMVHRIGKLVAAEGRLPEQLGEQPQEQPGGPVPAELEITATHEGATDEQQPPEPEPE